MNTRPTSPLSAQQWQTLETLAANARKAIDEFWFACMMNAGDTSDSELQSKLMDTAERAKAASDSISSLPYMLHCQPEWTGGDSSDAANFVLREPNVMGMRRLTVNA